MKAAIVYSKGQLPQYVDLPEPTVKNDDEVLVTVKAVAIKHFDKGRAAGNHYSAQAQPEEAKIIGGDGVCMLQDGSRVYGMGVSGMLAEKAIVHTGRIVPLPDGLDDATAAALPNGVIGAAMALKFKADIQPGDVVLINGATGFTGRIAVQIAKYYGAGKIIATGRNQQSLNELRSLGADEILSIQQDDEGFIHQMATIHLATPITVIIDYLWGHTAEMILACLKGDGSFTSKTRYISVGSMAGDIIQLSSTNLRSVNLQLSGSGLGAWSKQQVGLLFSSILPEMFQLAADGKLKINTTSVNLKDIADIWNMDVAGGDRLVVII